MSEKAEVFIPDKILSDRRSAQFAGVVLFNQETEKLWLETSTAKYLFKLEKVELKETGE